MYLKSKTYEYTTPQIRKVVLHTILWCKKNLGVNYRKGIPEFKVLTEKKGQCFGFYSSCDNTIVIHGNVCVTVKDIIKTVIHEYTHYLQNLRSYNKVLSIVGYKLHPQEIEARNNEGLYSSCWIEIKNRLK